MEKYFSTRVRPGVRTRNEKDKTGVKKTNIERLLCKLPYNLLYTYAACTGSRQTGNSQPFKVDSVAEGTFRALRKEIEDLCSGARGKFINTALLQLYLSRLLLLSRDRRLEREKMATARKRSRQAVLAKSPFSSDVHLIGMRGLSDSAPLLDMFHRGMPNAYSPILFEAAGSKYRDATFYDTLVKLLRATTTTNTFHSITWSSLCDLSELPTPPSLKDYYFDSSPESLPMTISEPMEDDIEEEGGGEGGIHPSPSSSPSPTAPYSFSPATTNPQYQQAQLGTLHFHNRLDAYISTAVPTASTFARGRPRANAFQGTTRFFPGQESIPEEQIEALKEFVASGNVQRYFPPGTILGTRVENVWKASEGLAKSKAGERATSQQNLHYAAEILAKGWGGSQGKIPLLSSVTEHPTWSQHGRDTRAYQKKVTLFNSITASEESFAVDDYEYELLEEQQYYELQELAAGAALDADFGKDSSSDSNASLGGGGGEEGAEEKEGGGGGGSK
jgi:hypothetical protein